MGYIYCITNTVNNKKYVGKTLHTVEKRFAEHKSDSKRRILERRPLYKAMNKYGVDKFSILTLEEVDDNDLLEEREKYWIEKLNTYGRFGYNATRGGDGKQRYNQRDWDEVIRLTKLGYNRENIIKLTGCGINFITRVQKINHLSFHKTGARLIGRFSLDGTQLLDSYVGSLDAIKFLRESGIFNNTHHAKNKSIRYSILRCCTGKLKSAYGFVWKYLPDLNDNIG